MDVKSKFSIVLPAIALLAFGGAAHAATADDAKTAALAAHPGGTAGKVELEDEDGAKVYGVEITAGGKKYDVKVDAGTGKILKDEVDDEKDEAKGEKDEKD